MVTIKKEFIQIKRKCIQIKRKCIQIKSCGKFHGKSYGKFHGKFHGKFSGKFSGKSRSNEIPTVEIHLYNNLYSLLSNLYCISNIQNVQTCFAAPVDNPCQIRQIIVQIVVKERFDILIQFQFFSFRKS